jgi:hypothetical protein
MEKMARQDPNANGHGVRYPDGTGTTRTLIKQVTCLEVALE